MSSHTLAVAMAIAVAGWLVLYATVRLRSRGRPVSPDPPRQELGPEPPAIVNLLANGWRLTSDAAEATLLDLAARGFLTLHQPTSDLQSTTVTPVAPGGHPGEASLRPYERRVLARVREQAGIGPLPVTALTFRDRSAASAWERRFRKEVVNDARTLGLSRARVGAETIALLTAAGGAVALMAVMFAITRGNWELALGLGLGGLVVSSALAGTIRGERDTEFGRECAEHWLGVRQWLRDQPGVADLPPVAAHSWGRRLAYGGALGVTVATSNLLDLGMGDERLVWSSYPGYWRRVRVTYPRGKPHYGMSVPHLLLIGFFLCFFAAIPIIFFVIVQATASAPHPLPRPIQIAAWPVLAVGIALVGYAGYLLIRGLIDWRQEHELTGEVLWIKVWRRSSSQNSRSNEPTLHYLAIDDGRSDHTTAWALPSAHASQIAPRYVVRVRVRPWTRRVVAHEVLAVPGQQRAPAAAPAGPAPPWLP